MNEPNDTNNTHDHDHDHDHGHDHTHDHAHDHDHDHGHGHDHDDPLHPHVGAPLDSDELDPANRALADALRVSFGVLKLIMIVLVVVFLASGVTEIDEGHKGIRLSLGKIVGDPGRQVLEPGWHFAWPEPIDHMIQVPSSVQQLTLDKSFWFFVPPGQESRTLDQLSGGNLQPGRDSSLITGDKNIVHGQFKVTYNIRDPIAFATNVSNESDPKKMLEEAERRVTFAAERGIVHVVSSVTADDFVRGDARQGLMLESIQDELDRMESGISISQVLLEQPTPPLQVRGAFQAVNQAESERAQKISDARKEASKILNEAAGPGFSDLLTAIDEYELARREEDADRIRSLEKKIDDLLDSDRTSGQASEIIRQALTYKTGAAKTVQAEAERFLGLLPQYNESPQIVLNRRWTEMRQKILSGDVQTFYISSDQNKHLYIEFNRDPNIKRESDLERMRKQQEMIREARNLGDDFEEPQQQ